MKTLGQIAYEAYREYTGGMSVRLGDRDRPFENLTPPEQAGWEAAGHAVDLHLCEVMDRVAHGNPTAGFGNCPKCHGTLKVMKYPGGEQECSCIGEAIQRILGKPNK